jgi:hypothetical protein
MNIYLLLCTFKFIAGLIVANVPLIIVNVLGNGMRDEIQNRKSCALFWWLRL